MSLKGSLNSVDLANIFQVLSINQKEGTLNIFDGQSQKSIYFSRDGVSMLSRGKPKQDSLGRILLRFDQLARDQLDRALGIQRRTGQLLGTVLEENEIVTREVVEDALRIQIEEEIYNLFIWKDAEFEFIEGAPPHDFDALGGNIRKLTFNVNSLIMEAARRIDDWTHIRSRVTSTEEIYRYSGRNADLQDPIFQEPYCDKVLGSIDGRTNVTEIIDRSFVNKFEVFKILAVLTEQGAVEVVPPADLAESAESAIAEGDLEHAVKFLKRVIDHGKDSPPTHLKIADAYLAVGEYALAAGHYRTYAEACLRKRSPGDAYDIYARVCDLLPTDLEAAERLVEIYFEYREEIEDHTDDVVRLGRALSAMLLEVGQRDRAVEILGRLTALVPEDVALRYLLVKTHLDAGQTEGALAEYQSMVDCYTRKKKWDEVGTILRKMLAIDPGRDDLKQRLDQVLTRRQKRRQSLHRLGWLILGSLVLGISAYFYLRYDGNARREITESKEYASQALVGIQEHLDRAGRELDSLARAIREGSRNAPALTETLREAEHLQGRCLSLIGEHINALEEVSDRFRFSTARKDIDEILQAWKDLGQGLQTKLASVRSDMHARAIEIANQAEGLSRGGRLADALDLYRDAAMLAVGTAPKQRAAAAELEGRVRLIEERLEEIEAGLVTIDSLTKAKRYSEARAAAISMVRENYDLEETLKRLPIPIRVESEPTGADIRINGEPTGVKTPGWVSWNPGVDTEISLELPGFLPGTVEIPAVNVLNLPAEIKRIRGLESVSGRLRREPVWSEDLGGPIDAEIAVAGDSGFISTRTGRIFRIDTHSRRAQLVHEAKGLEGIASRPIVVGKFLYLATIDGRLEKIDMKTGAAVWSQRLPGRVYAPLVAVGGRLVVGDGAGRISMHDASTGALVWRKPVPGEVLERPVLAGGRVFVTSSNGSLYIHSLSDGTRMGVLAPTDPGDRFVGSALVLGGRVYACSSRGIVHAFEISSRKRVWSVRLGGELRCGPAACGGILLVGALDGVLYAIRDGTVLDREELGGTIVSSPTVAGGDIYIANDTGLVLGAGMQGDRIQPRWRVDLSKESDAVVRVRVPTAKVGSRVLVTSEAGTVFILYR